MSVPLGVDKLMDTAGKKSFSGVALGPRRGNCLC